jgi:predicted small metal-binding protein
LGERLLCKQEVAGSIPAGSIERGGTLRVIDCDCGETVAAANDDDLLRAVRRHVEEAHADDEDMRLDDAAIRELVAAQAYDATDS